MRYKNIQELITSDSSAKEYFNSLPKGIQNALKAHGNGINTAEELKHFADIFKAQGGAAW